MDKANKRSLSAYCFDTSAALRAEAEKFRTASTNQNLSPRQRAHLSARADHLTKKATEWAQVGLTQRPRSLRTLARLGSRS